MDTQRYPVDAFGPMKAHELVKRIWWFWPAALLGVVVLFSSVSSFAQDAEKAEEEDKPAQPAQGDAGDLKKAIMKGLKILLPEPFDDELEELPEEEAEELDSQVDISRDAHAPVKTGIADLWRRTQRRLAENDHEQAYELLHHILIQAGDELIYSPDGQLISLRLLAQENLNQLPEEYRQTFIRQYSLLSQEEFERALAENDPHKIYEIASRYLLTEAGQRAANWLGAYHLDHSRYGLAAYWFDLLRKQNARLTRNFNWQSRLLLALNAAQKEQEAKDLLQQITQQYPEESNELQNMLEMWDQKIITKTNSQEPLEEWMIPFGNAGRNGIAQGGDPLLMPRWSYELTSDQLLQEQISTLVENLIDDQESLVVSAFPVFMDGFVAFKTLKGLAVLNVETGKLNWETQESHSPEELLSLAGVNEVAQSRQVIRRGGIGVGVNLRAVNNRGVIRMLNQFDMGMPASYNPLVRLLFKNSSYGNVSCDEQRVYTLEALATFGGPETEWGRGFRNGNFVDPFHRDWTSNKLVAYDLRSGRMHWVVGGSDYGDEFDHNLAGYFFHSAPVLYRNELLVIAEKENEIQLLALAPQTGALLWKQLIAFADTDISVDFIRRYLGGQVAVADGVIVCPTTSGWLVGVDVMTHSVLWANRYDRGYLDDEETRNWRNPFDFSDELADWKTTPPFIAQNSVIYAAPEGQAINCYDLQTGELIWGAKQQQRVDYRRQNAMFVAGVWNDLVLVVEDSQMVAYDLKRGRRVWKHAFTDSLGQPTGFGVMNESSYYLPFDSGQILKVDLQTGKQEESFHLAGRIPQQTAPLGNLALYQGRLLSFSWKGLQNFEQREFVTRQIEQRKSANPHDALALMKEAEMLLMDREYLQALQKLQGIDLAQVGADLKPEFKATLRRVFRSEKISRSEDLEWGLDLLEEEAVESQDYLLSQQLRIANDLLHEDYSAAFGRGLELISFVREHPQLYLEQDGQFGRRTRVDVWLARELENIWQAARITGQEGQLTQLFEPLLREADPQDVELLKLYSRLFDFHDLISTTRETLAHQLASTGEWPLAERIWVEELTRPISGSDEVSQERVTQAQANLVQLMRDHGCEADALYYELYHSGAENSGEVREAVNSLVAVSSRKPFRQQWKAEGESQNLTMRQLGIGYNTYENSIVVGNFDDGQAHLPWFHRYHPLLSEKQRVAFIETATGEQAWSVPLRGEQLSGYGEDSYRTTMQHLFVIQHGEMVSVLSPVDQRVLWTERLMINNSNDLYQHMPEDESQAPLRRGKHALSEQLLVERANESGMIAFVTCEVVGLYGRRRLDVLDILTGERLWSLTDLPRDTVVTGNRDVLLLQKTDPDTGRTRWHTLSTCDGEELEIDPELVQKVLYCNDEYYVTMDYEVRTAEPSSGESSKRSERYHLFQAIDLQTKKVFWTHEVNAESYISFFSSGLIIALDEEGVLSEFDLNRATTFRYDPFDGEKLAKNQQNYVLVDEEQLYLIGGEGGHNPDYAHVSIMDGMKTLYADGDLFCLNRQTGKLNWNRSFENQQLIVESMQRSPWLLFVSGEILDDEVAHQNLVIEVLDRREGSQLLKTSLPMVEDLSGFRTFADRQVVELLTSSFRLQIGYEEPDRPDDQEPANESGQK
ncbi:MAG: PQQ-binding-like beta-propeller repeat protein [Planctomycetaceae bacterium]|nr:PQQ-binding-like beta-propeller repeat protein [Planctomycetaceae bacterium]